MKKEPPPLETLCRAASEIGFTPIVETDESSFTIRDSTGTLVGKVSKEYIQRRKYEKFREELRDQYERNG